MFEAKSQSRLMLEVERSGLPLEVSPVLRETKKNVCILILPSLKSYTMEIQNMI